MSTAPIVPETPELTVNNSAAEIKAALESAAATTPAVEAVQPPTPSPAPAAAPPESQPYTVSETPEGVEIRLETGAVYKGKSWQEAAAALAKGKVEADKTLHGLRQRQPEPATPNAPAAPTEDPAEAATRSWIIEQVAKEFGLPVAQFKQAVGQMFDNSQKTSVNVAWTDFTQACPDYSDTKENAAALVEYLPPEVLAQQRPPSADDLRKAHALALYDKKYAATSAPNVPTRPMPPLMPTAGAGSQPGEQNPYAMPIHELRKAAFQQ